MTAFDVQILGWLAAGLTLIFGIMDFVNLAHGSLYMAGAYVAAQTMQVTGSFVAAVLMAAVITGLVGLVLELVLEVLILLFVVGIIAAVVVDDDIVVGIILL